MTASRFFTGLLLFLVFVFATDRIIGGVLEFGIYKYFDLHSKVDYLVIGSSPATLDLDKSALEKQTGKKFAFYAQQGATSEDRLVMIRHFLSINKSSLKGIIYELTPHIFTSSGLSSNSYQLLYPYISDSVADQYIKSKTGTGMEYIIRKISLISRFNETTLNFAFRGLLSNHSNMKVGMVDSVKLQKKVDKENFWKIKIDSNGVKVFRKTVKYLKGENLSGIYVFYPIIDILTKKDSIKVTQVETMVRQMVESYEGDIVRNYTHLFDGERFLYYDHLHLNKNGQKKFTEIFEKNIK